MRIIKLTVLALCLGVSVVWADDRPIYKDKNAPIEDRVEDLLRRMTLREKGRALQQRCTWDIIILEVHIMGKASALLTR